MRGEMFEVFQSKTGLSKNDFKHYILPYGRALQSFGNNAGVHQPSSFLFTYNREAMIFPDALHSDYLRV